MELTIRTYGTLGTMKCKLFKTKPLQDRPKTYKHVCTGFHNIGNTYNPSHCEILQNKRGELFIEIYRDGCFWPYYGKLEQVESIG